MNGAVLFRLGVLDERPESLGVGVCGDRSHTSYIFTHGVRDVTGRVELVATTIENAGVRVHSVSIARTSDRHLLAEFKILARRHIDPLLAVVEDGRVALLDHDSGELDGLTVIVSLTVARSCRRLAEEVSKTEISGVAGLLGATIRFLGATTTRYRSMNILMTSPTYRFQIIQSMTPPG